jgi:hypothetical protein
MFKNKRILGLALACVLMVLSLGLYIYSLGAISSSSELVQGQQLAQEIEPGPEKVMEKESGKEADVGNAHEAHADAAVSHSSKEEKSKVPVAEQMPDAQGKEMAQVARAPKEARKGAEQGMEQTAGKHAELVDKGHESKSHEELVEVDKKSEEFGTKYRPRIIGRCKLLFTQFNLQKLEPSQFHAFAYSFDGKSGYCADSGAQSSLKLAQEVALKDCEKNKLNVDGYAPCFIYSNN